eukprot:4496808-Amphidinium_carterae.1
MLCPAQDLVGSFVEILPEDFKEPFSCIGPAQEVKDLPPQEYGKGWSTVGVHCDKTVGPHCV